MTAKSAFRSIIKIITPPSIRARLQRSMNPMEKWKLVEPQTMDDSLLDMIITHRGHRLDKARKGGWSESKIADGSQYKDQLEAALETCRSRQRAGDHISWAQKVLESYKARENDKNRAPEPPASKSSPQPNDIFGVIKGRRSIRYFQPRALEKEVIEQILEAGLWAPCSGNRQSWHFVVQQVAKGGDSPVKEPETYDYQPLPHGAVVIYVATDQRIYPWKYAAAMDAAAAIQNMLLMAHHLGLGACWYYGAERLNQVKLRKRFGLPEYFYFYSTVQLGYPAETPEAPGRKSLGSNSTFIGFDRTSKQTDPKSQR